MSPDPVYLKTTSPREHIELSPEASLVRETLISEGLETPMIENGLSPQQKYERIRELMGNVVETLGTDDVAVSIDATHYCVKSRGVQDTNSQTSTTALGGCFRENIHTRAEFLNP